MAVRFNAAEVLEIAIRTEKNGEDFYRKAAALHAGKAEAGVLLSLAEMEVEHARIFEELKAALPPETQLDDTEAEAPEVMLYLDAIAGSHGGEGSRRVAAALSPNESLDAILQTAIHLEERSVLFYVGLLDVVPATLGRELVQNILNEERHHIVILEGERKKQRA